MAPLRPELREQVEDGIRLCRAGDWKKGLPVLASVLENRWPGEEAPGVIYSWLGFGVARYQGKMREGMKLCEHAVKQEFYVAENHFNMARMQLLANDRRAAVNAIEVGLKLDPDHRELLDLKRQIGVRRPPVFGFLHRDHPVNRLFGRLRHSFANGKR